MRSTWMLAAVAVQLLGIAAHAAEVPPQYDPRAAFAEADTNHDGVIDRWEFYNRVVEVFYHADGNKDGFLESQEIARLTFPDDMKNADTSHDGRITLPEFLRVRDLDYETADTNKDGVLSVDEVVGVYAMKEKK